MICKVKYSGGEEGVEVLKQVRKTFYDVYGPIILGERYALIKNFISKGFKKGIIYR